MNVTVIVQYPRFSYLSFFHLTALYKQFDKSHSCTYVNRHITEPDED